MAKLLQYLLIMAICTILVASGAYITLKLLFQTQQPVKMPDILGKDTVYALKVLNSKGLDLKVSGFEHHPIIQKDHIISQDPVPQDLIKRGRSVRVVLSLGPETAVIPSVMGLKHGKAELILKENELDFEIIELYQEEWPKGEVISQDPLPGEEIQRGAKVALLVSMGPRPREYVMPPLAGLSLDETIEYVETMGLILGHMDNVYLPDIREGTVIAHEPEEGGMVKEGDILRLKVNRRAEKYIKDRIFLFKYTLPKGFLRREVRITVNSEIGICTLLEEYLQPGRMIRLLILKSGQTNLHLYLDGNKIFTKKI